MALDRADAAALEQLPTAAEKLDALPREQRFAIAASLPDFLAERLRAEFGGDAEQEAEAFNERAPLTVRVNALKTDRPALMERLASEGVRCEPTQLSPYGITLETRLNAYSLPSFRDGLFEIQDEGSQLLGMLVDAPPTKVVDACAGAGGKTLQLAAQMKNRGDLHALDIDGRRLEELKRRARRASAHNIRIRPIPATGEPAREAVKELAGKMDRVLIDAPCSGTGTLRRKPDARYRLTPEAIADFAARQKELLARFSELVKPGGRLIYGTCSLLREENEQVVQEFLGAHPDFRVVPAADKLGEALAAKVSSEGFLRLTPKRHATDGFFGAILLRAK
jgi:16S rRNA (cytosine967-C5)-methyltransferase